MDNSREVVSCKKTKIRRRDRKKNKDRKETHDTLLKRAKKTEKKTIQKWADKICTRQKSGEEVI